jgi:hypothetical protein
VRRKLPRPSAGLAVALVALFVALGGSALAKVVINGNSIKKGSITGTQIKKGSLTGNQIKKNSLTGNQIKESSLGTVPSANNANQVGGKGAGSFEAKPRTALISGTATGANVLFQSGGFGSVTRVAAGEYLVDAGESVSSKPLSATISLSGAAHEVELAPCGGTANNPGGFNCPTFNDTNHLIVVTRNSAGALTDGAFYVSIGG